jgi:hypothetical protein
VERSRHNWIYKECPLKQLRCGDRESSLHHRRAKGREEHTDSSESVENSVVKAPELKALEDTNEKSHEIVSLTCVSDWCGITG